MGLSLFDDILKKSSNSDSTSGASTGDTAGGGGAGSTSGGSGGSQQDGTQSDGGQKPLIIKKTSEVTFVGANLDTPIPPESPVVSPGPTAHAEEDISGIIIPPASSDETVHDPLTQDSLISPTGSGEVLPSTDPMKNESVSATTTDGMSLFDTILKDEPKSEPLSQENQVFSTPEQAIIAPEATKEENTTQASTEVSEILENSVNSSQETTLSTLQEEQKVEIGTQTPQSNQAETTPFPSFSTPREFIEKNLINIDAMLEMIDRRHEAKITEAEGYKAEKLRYTELEKNAYTEATIMDRERDHGLHMKKILLEELDRDTENRNVHPTRVESTLKEISQDHPITQRHTHKKHEVSPTK